MSNAKSENAAQPIRVVADPNPEPTEEDRLRADWEQKKAEREKKAGKKKAATTHVSADVSEPPFIQPLEEATIQQLYAMDRAKETEREREEKYGRR